MLKNYKIFLDDERVPKSEGWMVIRDFDEFIRVIELNGLASVISFDHDLSSNADGSIKKSGYDCAKWLVDNKYDLRGVEIFVHSSNPVGRDNIIGLIKSWNKFLNENPVEEKK